jgi:hypothetical protein
VLIAGLFDIPKDIELKEIHAAAANELYPFVRAALVGLTSIAAVAPLPWAQKTITVEDLSEDNKTK